MAVTVCTGEDVASNACDADSTGDDEADADADIDADAHADALDEDEEDTVTVTETVCQGVRGWVGGRVSTACVCGCPRTHGKRPRRRAASRL
jgi:hypothetical protein